ncbi:MAG: hypothetical protein MRK01_05185 [Candidatus Scalindua sp.]|nr:hypothetical protein [Candidatus Scalindua sp.]
MKRPGIVLICSLLLVFVITLHAAADPLLSLGTTNVQPGDSTLLNLSITGEPGGTYAGVNARIILPEGVSVTGVSGGAGLPSGSFTIDHHPSSNGANEVAVIAYSGSGTYKGDSGVLLSLNLNVAASASNGTYAVKFAETNTNPLINSKHALSNADGSTSVAHSIQNGSLIVGSGGGGGTDTDGDGMEDVYEEKYGLNPLVDDRNGDLDGDGITNIDEYKKGTNPALDTKWVEFSSKGTEKGTFDEPYNTVEEGVQAVAPGGEVIIKAGTTDETSIITKKLIIEATGGSVFIGEEED